jgi:calcium-translocating P-type ATPase
MKYTGLSKEEVILSREKNGDNSLQKEKSKGIVRRFLENLSDPIIRILMIALAVEVAVTLGNCNFFEIFGILTAILISTTVSTVSEYTSEKSFEKLRAGELDDKAHVLRDNKLTEIPAADIVVGDIMYLYAGEKVLADGELLEGELTVDQSALNGESVECTKCPKKENSFDLNSISKVFRGTMITRGNAVMRVLRTGASTYYGMVANDLQIETRVSPLKRRLSHLATQISKIGYVMAVIVGIAFLFNSIVVENGFSAEKIISCVSDFKYVVTVLTRALTLMITVVVVAAPEGLPMMITVVLSANMKKMISENVLVKKLVGIETAGSLNILFTDKTGTITEGEPKCERLICDSGEYKNPKDLKSNNDIYRYLCLSAKYNTDVTVCEGRMDGGNSTDRAIYEWFKNEPLETVEIYDKSSFTSNNKYSKISIKNEKTIIKGAAEIMISASNFVMSGDGSIKKIDKDHYVSKYKNAAQKGERVIAVALSENGDLSNLILVSLITMKDKIRPGAKASVEDVSKAGIQVVMITGDSKETASAIAIECGILRHSNDLILGADELSRMSDEEVKVILPNLRVVARAMPRDKSRLVRLSQEMNLVVGMTGDGINDAPSLKLADVGFAMGSGTDIAKSAADIVILDNSFSAIKKTILYGRTIFKSIRKFITFQLTMNLSACGVSLIGQFVGIETPITIIQMLWINIIMDTLGGLAFAGEPAVEYYLREKPKSRDERILSKDMLHQIGYTGFFTLFLCVFFLVSDSVKHFYCSESSFYTAFYALFIFAGIFNCFAARSERLFIMSNILKNKLFISIMFLISVIQLVMIYHGGVLFRCVPLSMRELIFAISLAFTVIPFECIRRLIKKLT